MPWASKCMIALGAYSLCCAIAGWRIDDAGVRSGFAVGIAMFAAGAAAAQGRRSLRKAGSFVGMFLPVLAAAFWGWRALDYFNTLGTDRPQVFPAILLTIMAIGGLVSVMLLLRVRASNNIAERGYSIVPLVPTSTAAPPSQDPNE